MHYFISKFFMKLKKPNTLISSQAAGCRTQNLRSPKPLFFSALYWSHHRTSLQTKRILNWSHFFAPLNLVIALRLGQLGHLLESTPGFINASQILPLKNNFHGMTSMAIGLKVNAGFGPYWFLIFSFKNQITCLFNSNKLPEFYRVIKTLQLPPFMACI